jgi:hypothetical protein
MGIVKLMADYKCWPLWWAGEHELGVVDPPRCRSALARVLSSTNGLLLTYDAES